MPNDIRRAGDDDLNLAELIHDPAVLLMDEPTSALDPELTAEVLDMISDLRGVESLDLTGEDIRAIAEADIRSAANDRDIIVAIVGESDVVYGLARMYQAFVDEASWKVEVFRDMEAAKAWINEQTRESLGREMTFA